MSLESQIAALVSAANSLTSQVAGKMSQIDQKVDEATKSVPSIIRDLSEQFFYIDALNGDDTNVGTSTNAPLKTINGANGKAVNGARIRLYFKENQTHVVEGIGFSLQVGSIQLLKWGENSDTDSHPVLLFRPGLYNGSYFGYFVRLLNGTILAEYCVVKTEFDPGIGTLNNQSGFFGYTTSDVTVLMYRVAVSLKNVCAIPTHAGYSGRNIYMASTSIEVVENTTGMAKLLYNRASSYQAFTLDANSVALLNGLTWPDLIDYYADKRNILTNLVLP